jgi:urease accessory protein
MYDGSGPTWHAALTLQFTAHGGRTRCAARHEGPLRLQKPLYPEGPACSQAVIIHPPGGIAGGDALQLQVAVAPEAHALVTTPGAAKWYKANGRSAIQRVELRVAGTLEWLPQEAIVFDAADVQSTIEMELDGAGTLMGWDIVALGRRAMGERFAHGRFAQSLRLRRAGRLLWHERTRLLGGDALLASPVGLAGHPVFGCFWAAGDGVAHIDLEALRTELGDVATTAALTRLAPELLVARVLADGTQAARRALERIWHALRPRLIGRQAQSPRLWAT